MPRPPLLPTCLCFHDRAVRFVGPLGAVAAHVHAAPALLVGLEGEVQVDLPEVHDGGGHRAEVLWVPPGLSHTVQGHGRQVAVIYLEPTEPEATRALDALPMDAPRTLASSDPWHGLAQSLARAEPGPALARLLDPDASARPASPGTRVRRAALALRRPGDSGAEFVAEVARPLALSGERLRHLFRAQVGTSMRRYRLWRRLQEAALAHLDGASLAQAAAASGFSDQAHFTRAFGAMFGLPPSAVLSRPGLRWTDLRRGNGRP